MAKEETISTAKLFGLKEKKMRELVKLFQHAKIESGNMSDLAEKLDILNSGKIGFLCFLFGRMVERNESSPEDLLRALLK